MPKKKDFFLEETVAEALQHNILELKNPNDITDVLEDLPKDTTVIVTSPDGMNSPYRPERLAVKPDSEKAGRVNFKRGDWLKYGCGTSKGQPESLKAAKRRRLLPWQLREKAVEWMKEHVSIEDNFFQGFSYHGLRTNDGRRRVIPVVESFQGAKIITYSASLEKGSIEMGKGSGNGIEVELRYINHPTVGDRGAIIRVRVPSREIGGTKYDFALTSYPIVDTPDKMAIIYNLDTQGLIDIFSGEVSKSMSMFEKTLYDYDPQKDVPVVWFMAHQVAGYVRTAQHFWKPKGMKTPMDMNPFPMPSKKASLESEFIDNRLLIRDHTLKSKNQLRHPHKDEKGVLLMRRASMVGADGYLFAKAQRDGLLRNYSWSLE